MKLAVVLALLTVFGVSHCNAQSSSASTITRLIRIKITITYTYPDGTQDQQIFTITISDFQTILNLLKQIISNLPKSLQDQINPLVTRLQNELTILTSDPTNTANAKDLATDVTKLFDILTASTNVDLQAILNDLKQFLSDPNATTPTPVVVTTPKATPKPAGPTTTKPATTVKPTRGPSISIGIEVDTDPTGVTPTVTVNNGDLTQFVVNLMNLILKTSNPSSTIKNIFTQIQTLLDSLSNKLDYKTLMQLLMLGINLGRQADGSSSITALSNAIESLVLGLLPSLPKTQMAFPSEPLLFTLLIQANKSGLMTNAQLDAALALLSSGKQNDPINLLKALLALLQSVLPAINSQLKTPLQNFINALSAYVNNPSIGSKNVISTVTALINAIISYTGSDRNQLVLLGASILRVLIDALPGDSDALNALLKKLLSAAPTATDPNSGGTGCTTSLLGGLLCNIGNLLGGVLGGTNVGNGLGGLAAIIDGLLGSGLG